MVRVMQICHLPNTDKTSFNKSLLDNPMTFGSHVSSRPGRLVKGQENSGLNRIYDKCAYQYTGPQSSLTNSSALLLNPSSAIFFAYINIACLYSWGLSSNLVACNLVSRCPRVSAELHQVGLGFSAESSSAIPAMLPSMVVMMPRFAIEPFPRCLPCQKSEPSAHHPSASLTQVSIEGSYE